MSLLLANGHPDARHYPIGRIVDEARLVVERLNHHEANRATLLQMAVSSILSKDGAKAFQKAIRDLTQ